MTYAYIRTRALVVLLSACAVEASTNVELENTEVDLQPVTRRLLANELPIPAAPADPAPVDQRPCPSGYVERREGSAVLCAPFSAQPPTCGDHEFVVPGGACERVGTECPAGPLPAEEAGAYYVLLGAAAEGADGSYAHPYPDLTVALSSVPAGAKVVVSKGLHLGQFTIQRDIRVVGTCAEETILRANLLREPNSAQEFRITVQIENGELSNVTVSGRPGLPREQQRDGLGMYGQPREGGMAARAQDIIIENVGMGIMAIYGNFSTDRILIRDTHRMGIYAGHNADLQMSNVEIRRPGHFGGYVNNGARVEATRLLMRDHREDGIVVGNEEPWGFVTMTSDTKGLQLTESAFFRIRGPALGLDSEEAQELTHLWIEEAPLSIIAPHPRSNLRIDNLTIKDTDLIGVVLSGGELRANDVYLDTDRVDYFPEWSEARSLHQIGFSIAHAAHFQVERALVVNFDFDPFLMSDSTIYLSDIDFVDTRSGSEAFGGVPIYADESTLTAERIRSVNSDFGINLKNAHATIRDLQLAEAEYGIGSSNSTVTVERALLRDLDWPLLHFGHDESTTLTDVVTENTSVMYLSGSGALRLDRSTLNIRDGEAGIFAAASASIDIANSTLRSSSAFSAATAVVSVGGSVSMEACNLSNLGTGIGLMGSNRALATFEQVHLSDAVIGATLENDQSVADRDSLLHISYGHGVIVPVASSTTLELPAIPGFLESGF